MGRILSIDYGDVRTGLALSDPTGMLASGIGCISCGGMRNTAKRVAEIAAERGAELIVIGLPRNMDGSEGGRTDTVRAFAALLAEYCSLPVEYADERLTTVLSYKYMNETNTRGKARKAAVDTLSAQIILQDYLDKKKN